MSFGKHFPKLSFTFACVFITDIDDYKPYNSINTTAVKPLHIYYNWCFKSHNQKMFVQNRCVLLLYLTYPAQQNDYAVLNVT